MTVHIAKLTRPTEEIAAAFTKWENDPAIIHLIRPHQDQHDLDRRFTITVKDLEQRTEHHFTYLIFWNEQLVGEVDYQLDPPYLYKWDVRTAWLGIIIGEETARGKGVGRQAIQLAEAKLQQQGIPRIELGVFEFNANALKLYQNLGYQEIGRIENFTFWQDRMWKDIRLEKYL